jgi:hypothetical protein
MPGLPFQQLPAGQAHQISNMPLGVQQPKTSPIDVISNQYSQGRRQVIQWFDTMRAELDQQQLPVEEYIQAIDQLREQARQQELKLKQQVDAAAQSVDTILSLVEEGSLPQQAGQRALWRIAGLDNDMIDSMFPETKPTDWFKEHSKVTGEINRLLDFTGGYDFKGNKLYRVHKTGSKKGEADKNQPADEGEIQQFVMANNLIDYFEDYEQNTIYPNLTPMQQKALLGTNILEKQRLKGRGRKMLEFGLRISPAYQIGKMVSGLTTRGRTRTPEEAFFGPGEGTKQTKPMVRINPDTNERIVSYDGGKTWESP